MTFIGREAELDALRQAWLRRDEFPLQFVVLVGESRIGKTRVVQEFYRWLNSNQDHHNYWPDTLETAQDSLHVNPSFDGHEGSAAVLPWLWWGLRWTRPDARNPEESLRCAVISDADHLRPHLKAAQMHAAQRSAGGKAAAGVAKTAANLLTGGLLGPLIEFGERVQEWRELRAARNRGAAEIGERIDGQRVDELGSLTALLLSMVGTDEVIEAGVPLILVLDDVHWADPAGLSFLLNLSREILRRSTPQKPFPRVVVVATVWEREWNIAHDAPLSDQAESAPASLSEAIRALEVLARREALTMPRLETLRLGRLSADLHPLVRESLPGLTQSQVELVAQRAGGSPGLLVELLLKLSGRSRHLFKDGDPKQELTRRGEASVRDMQVSYHDLVEERLQTLEPTEASVMRLASYVGLAYSRPFVAELAQLLAARDALLADQAGVEAALRRADHPLSIVQAASQSVDEFRLPVYRDILRRQLSESEQLWEGLVSDAMHLVRNWLEQDRVRDLAANERDAFLEFAVAELQAVAQGDGFVEFGPALLMAFAEVACNVELEGLVTKAGQVSRTWRNSYRPMSEESLLRMGRRRLTGLFRCMQLVDDTATARRLAGDAIQVLRLTNGAASPLLCICLRYAGDIALASDQLIEAQESYRDSHLLAERILAEFGPSAERLRDVSISKERVANVLLRQDQVDEALGLHRESLALAERILAEFGPSAERLRDVSVSRYWVADVLLHQDQVDEALGLYRESLALVERILAEFGPSAERLCDVSVSRCRVADVLLRQDQVDEALGLYRESLALAERILAEFGPTAQRLRGVSLSKTRVADVLLRQDQLDEALGLYRESLALAERILAEFGPSATRLSEVSASLRQVAEALMCKDKVDEALRLNRESVGLDERILAEFGPSAFRLRELHVSKFQLAEALLHKDKFDEALGLLRESLALVERILVEFGPTADRLLEVSHSKLRVAMVLLDKDQMGEALRLCRESVMLAEHVLADFGPGAHTLFSVSRSKQHMADVLNRSGQVGEALGLYRESLALDERVLAEFGPRANRLSNVVRLKIAIADALMQKDQVDEALGLYRESLTMAERTVAEFGQSDQHIRNLCASKERVAAAMLRSGQLDEALGLLRESRALAERVLADLGPSSERLRNVSVLTGRVADVLLRLDQSDEALGLFRESLALDERALAAFGPGAQRLGDASRSKFQVAEVLLRQEQVDEALGLFQESLALDERILDDYGPSAQRLTNVNISKVKVADALMQKDQVDEALGLYRESLTLAKRIVADFGPSDDRLSNLLLSIGAVADALVQKNRLDEALGLYRESLALAERILAEFGPNANRLRDLSISKNKIADVLLHQDQMDEALRLYRESLTLEERILAEFGPSADGLRQLSCRKYGMAEALLRQDRVDEAQALYRESLTLNQSALADLGPSAQRLHDVYVSSLRVAEVLLRQDQADEALGNGRRAETHAAAVIGMYGVTSARTENLQAARRLISLALLRLERVSEGFALLEQHAAATGQDAWRSWFKSPPDHGQSAELDDAYFAIESNPGRAIVQVTKALVALWPELLAGRKLKTSVEKDVASGEAALVTLTSEELGDSEHAAFLWRRQLVVLLDGTSQPILWARELGWIDSKTSQAAISFAALFGRYVYAQDGPFVLLRAPSEIPWTEGATPADVARVEALEPFAPVSRADDEQNFIVEACVLFCSQLLRVRYRVPRRRGLEKIEGEAIASDLPVWRYRYEKGWHLRVLEELPGARV